MPLWQVLQVPDATPLWVKVAGSQAVVLWQASQLCVVTTWFEGLPAAVLPLWQVEQLPAATAL